MGTRVVDARKLAAEARSAAPVPVTASASSRGWLGFISLLALAVSVVGPLGTSPAIGQCFDYSVAAGPATFIPGTTNIGLGNWGIQSISLPFPCSLYGNTYTSVNACSSGTLQFQSNNGWLLSTCLPTTDPSGFDDVRGFGPTIFPCWDFLDTEVSDGKGVFTSVSGTPGSRVFAIEWRTGYAFSEEGSPPSTDFEVLLYENQSYFDVVFSKAPNPATNGDGNVDNGNGAVVGVQASNAGPATVFECQAGAGTSLVDGLSLRFTCVNDLSLPGVCCYYDFGCFVCPQVNCPSTYFFPGATCTPNPCPPPPGNDTCSGAINLNTVSFPYTVSEDAQLATADIVHVGNDIILNPNAYIVNGVWFTFTAPAAGFLTCFFNEGDHSVTHSEDIPHPFVMTPPCTSYAFQNYDLGFNNWGSNILYNYTAAGQTADVCFSPGSSGSVFATSPYHLTFNFVVPAPPPNDSCANAAPLGAPGAVAGDLKWAGPTTSIPAPCGNDGFDSTTNPDVWYSIMVTSLGHYTFEVVPASDDPSGTLSLGVFTDCNGSLVACGSNRNTTASGPTTLQMSTLLKPGAYLIRVSATHTPVGSRTAREFAILDDWGTFQLSVSAPSCPADFNHDGHVTVQDIFSFLTAWFAKASSADINGDGSVTVQDIFTFLTDWFAGC